MMAILAPSCAHDCHRHYALRVFLLRCAAHMSVNVADSHMTNIMASCSAPPTYRPQIHDGSITFYRFYILPAGTHAVWTLDVHTRALNLVVVLVARARSHVCHSAEQHAWCQGLYIAQGPRKVCPGMAMVWLCVLWYAVFSGARTYALAPLGHMPLLRCPALAHSSQSGLKDSSSGFGLGLLIKGSPLLLAGSPLLLAACPLPLARSFSFLSFLSCSI